MPVSLDYVARETASNLWRNRLMTIAAVLTVAVSLSLVGTALLLRQGVAHATTQWQHGVSVELFLKPSVSATQEASVRQQLHQLPYVESCTFRSQAYDFSEAKRLLTPDESQALTVATTPSSLRCVLNNPSQAQAIARQFDGYPGVSTVSYPGQAIKNMEQFTRILQLVFVILAVILLLSASVLILNTIRLAIFARRREVSVMKLVGATNWFIRVPFMFEGVIQGLLGALVAAVVVVVLHLVLDALGSGQTSNVLSQMRLSTHEVVFTSLVVLLIGVFIGSIGSALGIRRFLDA
ncbi:MAG TPA: permease-like cell division protein FtsX [Acidimicrobiales bacterium]|nr:permease-like cell division protein FtsX [Acidimicrobiales bacterium]